MAKRSPYAKALADARYQGRMVPVRRLEDDLEPVEALRGTVDEERVSRDLNSLWGYPILRRIYVLAMAAAIPVNLPETVDQSLVEVFEGLGGPGPGLTPEVPDPAGLDSVTDLEVEEAITQIRRADETPGPLPLDGFGAKLLHRAAEKLEVNRMVLLYAAETLAKINDKGTTGAAEVAEAAQYFSG